MQLPFFGFSQYMSFTERLVNTLGTAALILGKDYLILRLTSVYMSFTERLINTLGTAALIIGKNYCIISFFKSGKMRNHMRIQPKSSNVGP
jgi:hypothetical protein